MFGGSAAATGAARLRRRFAGRRCLAPGPPYHRFTDAALTDPNGFAGVNGIFRFKPDGTLRARAGDLGVEPDGFQWSIPRTATFQAEGLA